MVSAAGRAAEKSAPARRRQQGAALLIFSILVVLTALAYLLSGLTLDIGESRRERVTQEALTKAREALIGYALRYREEQMAHGQDDRVYGYLPLPDLGTSRNNNTGCTEEGCDAANFAGNALNASVVGRLPWRTLGLEPLRDGYSECLWYLVSGSHQRQQRVSPMNFDTLGHLDVAVANGSAQLQSILANAHEQPVAVIFSAGPPLGGQNRGAAAGDDVTSCGGNYDAANYLDMAGVAAAGNVVNFLDDPNHASRVTDSDAQRRILSLNGRVFTSDGIYLANRCEGNCSQQGNDSGLALSSDSLFGAIRKHAYYRTDINMLLDRAMDCLRDLGVAGGYGHLAAHTCYDDGQPPRGYFSHYQETLFTAGGTMDVNGENCAGALLFANQRAPEQLRTTAAEKGDVANYLEGINLGSFGGGTEFSGQEIFERISLDQGLGQDIVRCIPATPSFATVQSAALDAAGIEQLAHYDATSRTLILGIDTSPIHSALANYLYGAAWRPEIRPASSGLRSYFTFTINDSGAFTTSPIDGFTFAIVDGDNNDTNAAGAAGQHLGYSGNNTESPFIAPPKIAVEIDLRRDGSIFPSSNRSHLANGRNDPLSNAANYRGGHIGLVYWGSEMPSDPWPVPAAYCVSPAHLSVTNVCTLPAEEDDNVHGQTAMARPGFPVPPANPAAPIPRLTVPPDEPQGLYKLDPSAAGVPTNRLFHMRVELTRAASEVSLPRVRVATTNPINLNSAGTLINGIHRFQVDGVFLFPGDRVLVKDQAPPHENENGIWVWKGADQPMERAPDANTVAALAGLVVEVQQGKTQARQLWRQATRQAGVCADSMTCTNFVWQSAAVTDDGDLPPPASQPDGIVYVRKGAQANAWFHSNGTLWQRISADLSTREAVDLANVPANIDGLGPATGRRLLVRHQANPAENGVYLWEGADIRGQRTVDFDSPAELAGSLVQVLAGHDAGRAFRQTTLAASGTIGTDAITWKAIDGASQYLLEVWLLRDSTSNSRLIKAMQDTTRSMAFLTSIMTPPPNFPPQLRDRPVIPYPFRNARLGFTVGQRTARNDQTITIKDFATTWLP